MDKKEFMIKFMIFYIVTFIMWPLFNWLWTFIDGSQFVFHFGRNCWIATGLALVFTFVLPTEKGKKE